MATLYHIPRTISSPIVQTLLELGVSEDKVKVQEMTFASIKLPDYLQVNPMGTSPAFKDGDLHLYESGAIMSHLLETLDAGHKMHPAPGSPTRALYLQHFFFVITTVYPFLAKLFLHTLQPADKQDAKFVADSRAKWLTVMGPSLVASLGDKPYLLGDEASAVDFLLGKPLNNADAMGLLATFPTLQALFKRVSDRETFTKAYAPTM
mmetsp:Transcript_44352/g.73909  ORF Transcript_44352/g.73909 Transcript_44352/m.73909 type:complete len:207 (+) Transcript_44352:226-846(+)|eukprot:CAMPEP_0198209792 /NCGR_PEP_ID=MMETSP1445-20131203/17733_1 /TAXON_ID=36898 /ORGANISM="Pyramimonas sp., Strain CCMP2087" /LENGTH=206 /DNA_ID=CAMNT_0043883673 /DNA_START=198 /DNA_END=818 /DNA_ORIENTATION=+